MERDRYLHDTVEHTTPVWRVLGVGLTAGAIVVLGFYLEQVGFADEFSTVAAVAVLGTIKFWTQKRPDQVRLRAGPFAKVADALRESLEDINAWVLERPLRVGFVIAVFYGIGLVILKTLILVVVASVYDWRLTAFVGLLIGAAAAAPQLFSAAGARLSGSPIDSTSSGVPKEPREVESREKSAEIESIKSMTKGQDESSESRNREDRPENIGYYDEDGNPVSPEEFERLFASSDKDE